MSTPFDRFYADQTPENALDLAIADARANKLGEFESALIKARDMLNARTEALRPFAGLDIEHAADKRDSHPVYAINATQFTFGDVRRAKAALRASA